VIRPCHGISGSIASGNDRNLLHGITMLAFAGYNRMTGLMISGNSLIAFSNYPALLLGTHEDLIYALVKFLITYKFLICSCRKYCSLIKQVRKIRTRKTARDPCHCLEIDVGRKRFVAGMYFKYLFSAANVR